MLLAIDIGNTDTVIGVFDGEKLVGDFRVASALNLTVDEAGLFVSSLFHHHIDADTDRLNRVAVCSVVPHLTDIYQRMAKEYFSLNPLIIGCDLKLPFQIDYPHPEEIGPDRLANAAAGFARFGGPLIVVDLGTATTFDVISKTGAYLGGVIAPGPHTAGENLAHKAARLFEVDIEKPERVIGKSTTDAIKSGLLHGTVGLIDHILELIFDELGGPCQVIATGGKADVYAAESKYVETVLSSLTLEGIRLITNYND